MCAMHQALQRAYAGSPHCLQATFKAVHTYLYSFPCTKCVVVQEWLVAHAHWEGAEYMSWTPKGHTAISNCLE